MKQLREPHRRAEKDGSREEEIAQDATSGTNRPQGEGGKISGSYKGGDHRNSTSTPEALSASFRNFLGVREHRDRRTNLIWAESAGATLPQSRDRKEMKRIEMSGA